MYNYGTEDGEKSQGTWVGRGQLNSTENYGATATINLKIPISETQSPAVLNQNSKAAASKELRTLFSSQTDPSAPGCKLDWKFQFEQIFSTLSPNLSLILKDFKIFGWQLECTEPILNFSNFMSYTHATAFKYPKIKKKQILNDGYTKVLKFSKWDEIDSKISSKSR